MTILDLTTYPDEVLTSPARQLTIGEIKGHEIQTLIEDMKDTCVDLGGVGLAAPQVGKDLAIFVVRFRDGSFETFINPEVVWSQGKQHCKGEGCLSAPGKRYNVKRPKQVKLKYIGESGEEAVLVEKRKRVTQILMHEMDHLLGKVLPEKGKEIT